MITNMKTLADRVFFTDNNVTGPSTATGLAPGTYSITVTDDNGCETNSRCNS